MPVTQDGMFGWCQEQKVLLMRLADQLESGATVVAEKQPDGSLVDNSPQTLAQIKSSLASLDRLLAEPRSS